MAKQPLLTDVIRGGPTLLWDAVANAERFGLVLGSVDGDPGVRPSLHIFVRPRLDRLVFCLIH